MKFRVTVYTRENGVVKRCIKANDRDAGEAIGREICEELDGWLYHIK